MPGGQRETRVVGGANAPQNEYPFMTALIPKGQNGASAQSCPELGRDHQC
ncbi:MAG: secreted trypsin-like serine protease [Akkermansiaceae bacterium]|jgi:secreted trypsin-like serine protease